MKRSITFDRLKRLVRESLGEDDLSANGDLDERFNEVRREVEDAQDYVYEGNYAEAVKHLDKALSLGRVLKDDLAKCRKGNCRTCRHRAIRFGSGGRPYDYNDRIMVCDITGKEVNPDTDGCEKYEK